MSVHPHIHDAPSPWVERWAHLLLPGSSVLDIACGHGRHTQFFSERGHVVTAVDSNADALAQVALRSPRSRRVQADIENTAWPLQSETFDAVVVTNYLWRALFPQVIASLANRGVLLCETFAQGNETVGKPSRSDFLLRHGELLQLCGTAANPLHVVAFEDGFLPDPPRFVQRIAAVAINDGPNAHQLRAPNRYSIG